MQQFKYDEMSPPNFRRGCFFVRWADGATKLGSMLSNAVISGSFFDFLCFLRGIFNLFFYFCINWEKVILDAEIA